MDDCYENELRLVSGRRVRVEKHYDSSMGPPWKENDGYGPVRDLGRDRKRPGERLFGSNNHHAYDFQEAVKIAKRDGWSSMDTEMFMGLTAAHRRVPTKGMVAAETVEREFQYLCDWCNDDWHYCSITVIDEATGVDRSCCGFDSNDDAGHEDFINEAVEDMYEEVVQALLVGEAA